MQLMDQESGGPCLQLFCPRDVPHALAWMDLMKFRALADLNVKKRYIDVSRVQTQQLHHPGD
jgi:hypothetical protein